MRYLRKFEQYSPEPAVKPAVKPAPTKPGPAIKPNRPSPLRRDKPSVEPAPKAKKKFKLVKGTVNDVISRYKKDMASNENVLIGDALSQVKDMFSNEDWYHSVSMQGQRGDECIVLYSNRPLNKEELNSIPDEVGGMDVILTTNKNIK